MAIPKVRDDDPEDVSWALSTAATQFARGDRAEAVKWLRRAAEAASEADHDSRALELAKAAADLMAAPPPPPPKPPAPAAKAKPVRKSTKADDTGKQRAALKPTPPRKPPSEERTDPHMKPPADADGWPTEAMKQTELDALAGARDEVYGQERTRIGTAYKPEGEGPVFRASQAVAVVVWRAADGSLRIAPKGTAISAVTIEAVLVAPAPDVDLLAWLGV